MKKIVSALVLASMMLSSTQAVAHDRRWGVDDNRYSPYYHGNRGRIDTGDAIAIGLGALILGAAIGNTRRDNRPVVVQQPYYQQEQQVCETIETRDYYGNLMNRRTVCYYPR